MFIDPRSVSVVDAGPFANSLGNALNQALARRLQKKALNGDEDALVSLGSRDPNRARGVGSILLGRKQDEAATAEAQKQAQAQRREMQAKVARGFTNATDKRGYLSAAIQQLADAGMGDMAAELQEDLADYEADPQSVESQMAAAVSMFENPERGLKLDKLDFERDKLESNERIESLKAEDRNAIELKKIQMRELEVKARNAHNDLERQKIEAQIEEKKKNIQKIENQITESNTQKEMAREMSLEAAQLAREIMNDDRLSGITGSMEKLPTIRMKSQDLVDKANRLQALLTADNLKLMSGVLTDKDIGILTRIGSGLNVTDSGIKGSLEGVKARLNDIARKIEASVDAPSGGGTISVQNNSPAAGSGRFQIEVLD